MYPSLISPSRISLPRFHYRVGLHIVLFEVCSAFTHVAACTLARSPIRDRYPGASDISSPPCQLRLLPAGANRRVGLAPTGKAPPCHSPTSYLILLDINTLRNNIQILANMGRTYVVAGARAAAGGADDLRSLPLSERVGGCSPPWQQADNLSHFAPL